MTHTLLPDDTTKSSEPCDEVSPESAQQISELEARAEQTMNLGLTGGGIGGLALGILIPWVINRRGKK